MKRKNERIITYQKIEEYGQWLESCERSRETVKKYRHYLKQFKEFIGDGPVTKEVVLLWKADLRERLTPVTINCVIAALNGFFKYCGCDGCESKFLKISKSSFYPERKELTKDEYGRLVKTAFANGNERLALDAYQKKLADNRENYKLGCEQYSTDTDTVKNTDYRNCLLYTSGM